MLLALRRHVAVLGVVGIGVIVAGRRRCDAIAVVTLVGLLLIGIGLAVRSSGLIGRVRSRVVLMWSRFDPATGRYPGPGQHVAGAGGALIVTLLGSSLWLLRRMPRTARPEADRVREP